VERGEIPYSYPRLVCLLLCATSLPRHHVLKIALSSWTTYFFTGSVFCASIVLIGAQQISKDKRNEKGKKEFVKMASLYQNSDTLEMEDHEVL